MIINANNIIPEFTQANMNAIVQAYPLGGLQYRGYFPLSYNTDLTFANLENNAGAKVMAKVVAKGSKAPRLSREFIQSIKGEIPKIEIARDLTENDLFRIQSLRNAALLNPANAAIRNQLIDKIYSDAPFVLDSVNARIEWMAKRAASTGKIDLTAGNNAIGLQNITLDFGVTVQNAAKDWSDATADTIADFDAVQNAVKGFRLLYATTDSVTAGKLTKLQSTREFVYGLPSGGSTNLLEPTLDQLNQRLAEKRLPQIRIWDSAIAEEGKDGALTANNGWEEGNIVFTMTPDLGATQYTTSPEFYMSFGDTQAQAIKDGFILVKTFGVQDPILVSTKGTAFAIPVLNNTKQTVILKTKLA